MKISEKSAKIEKTHTQKIAEFEMKNHDLHLQFMKFMKNYDKIPEMLLLIHYTNHHLQKVTFNKTHDLQEKT